MSGVTSKAKVVVIGGGYGGATAAKYVRLLSDYKIDMVQIKPSDAFVSCPMSNLVVSDVKQIDYLTTSYVGLSKNHGITVVKDFADNIDTVKKNITLRGGSVIAYDELVVSPGVELIFGSVDGLQAANASGKIVQV